MSRIQAALAAVWILAASAALVCAPAAAQDFSAQDFTGQDFSALARVDPQASRIADLPKGRMEIVLSLSQGVPWRLFTLGDPRRLVLDFREIDWSGLDPDALVTSDHVLAVRAGSYRPGLSRLVLALDGPMEVRQAGLSVSDSTGRAELRLLLLPTSPEIFAATTGAPHDPLWDLPEPVPVTPPRARGPDTPVVVVLDPGHGGIDPGAEQDGLSEKALMLTFAREIRETLLRAGGFEVLLTREDDRFVSLERRVAIAHEAQADVFISLHADSLAEGHAHGATVYVLSDESSDKASELLAQRHERDEILSGVDLSQADDEVTDILLDLARQETRPRTRALARSLVEEMTQKGGPMNRRPLRLAGFSVLKAADIPSVLVEIGFLSSPRDLKNLQNPRWRAGMAEAVRAGLQAWQASDAARKDLVRQ